MAGSVDAGCAAEASADCVLRGKTALIMTGDLDAWNALSSHLAGLGLSLRSGEAAGPAPLLFGEPVDLVVLDGDVDVDATLRRVDVIVVDRPWVPVLVATTSGGAVRVHAHGDLTPAGMPGARSAPQSLRRMVVQALCRVARHARPQPDCDRPRQGGPAHGEPAAGRNAGT
jgi:hypothetical protein